jgi:hypothetical protein
MALSTGVGSGGLSGVAAWLDGVLRVGEAARLRDDRSPCRLRIIACCKEAWKVSGMWLGPKRVEVIGHGVRLRVLGLRQNWRAGGHECGRSEVEIDVTFGGGLCVVAWHVASNSGMRFGS